LGLLSLATLLNLQFEFLDALVVRIMIALIVDFGTP